MIKKKQGCPAYIYCHYSNITTLNFKFIYHLHFRRNNKNFKIQNFQQKKK